MNKVLLVLLVLLLSAGIAVSAPLKSEPRESHGLPRAKNEVPDHSLTGKVVETMDSGGYTYVCIEKNGKKIWVAIPETTVRVGQELAFEPGQEMVNFESKSLNRTFESIVFSPGLKGNAGINAAQTLTPDHGGSKAAAAKGAEKIAVEKAAGPDAYTVSEIFAQRAKLHKKTVTVKAKVVKVSSGIMGRNWIHLQDGTGDAAKGTNNLVATSDQLPSVGDVVTVKGKVYKDKDFGAGYKYKVILEQAVIHP